MYSPKIIGVSQKLAPLARGTAAPRFPGYPLEQSTRFYAQVASANPTAGQSAQAPKLSPEEAAKYSHTPWYPEAPDQRLSDPADLFGEAQFIADAKHKEKLNSEHHGARETLHHLAENVKETAKKILPHK